MILDGITEGRRNERNFYGVLKAFVQSDVASSSLSTMKRSRTIIWCISIVLVGLVLLVLGDFEFSEPRARCRELRQELISALDNASSVKVVEHSNWRDNYRGTFDPNYEDVAYATVVLTPEQIGSLRQALPLTLDYSGVIVLKCTFVEHHYIEIARHDGSVLTLHICFHCGEIEVDKGYQRIMPWGWNSRLRNFISSLGLHPDGPWNKKS